VTAAGAIHEDAAQAHLAHLAKGDLDWPTLGVRGRVAAGRVRHAEIQPLRGRQSNYRLLVARTARELLRVVGVEKRSLRSTAVLRPPAEAVNDESAGLRSRAQISGKWLFLY
jgi:hypothetical protein